ncbi:hypothetical protein AgCh_007908 [Apium graveolens]
MLHKLDDESFAVPREPSNVRRDVEMGTQRSGELGLENFLEQVQEIDRQYDRLNTLLHKLQTANEESKTVTKASSMKGMMLSCSLKKKFKDKITEFQKLRQNIQQEYREVVERRVFTVTGNKADDQTIDRLIETGDSEQIFQKAIQEQGRGQIMSTVAEMQERHDAVREIERKLLELQQIFLDMAVLVDSQGDMLDNIETHVSNAVDHVQSGNKALLKAKSLRKSTRKWMCIAILILLIVIVVVVGVLHPWKKS